MEERISREDIVRLYNIEITFFDDLASNGLIQTEVINNTTYLHYDQLSAFERFTNWHYDLEVNMAGLEIIHHLLQQIEEQVKKYNNDEKSINFEVYKQGLLTEKNIGKKIKPI